MKSLKESILESILVHENILRGKLSKDGVKNHKIISKALRDTISEISDWMEENMDDEDFHTDDLAGSLSKLAQRLEDWYNHDRALKK